MKGVRTMFGRLFLSTGSDTFAGAKAKSFAPSAPPYSISDRLILTITCTLPSSKNNEFFLRRRVTRQKKMDFFCAAGLQVKKRRLRQHKMLPLNKKTAKKLVHKHFFSTFEALINRRVSNTALNTAGHWEGWITRQPHLQAFWQQGSQRYNLDRDQARRRRDTRKNNHIERAKAWCVTCPPKLKNKYRQQ